MKSVSQIRKMFIDFFASKGHQHVASSSLVPINDPTILFINAGMNQFKNVFLGLEKRDYDKAVTAQRCLRAGGKQNDLDNVGYTARHHTFFEMLGNFSFGDYFKEQAIIYCWELLTSKDYFALPKDRLYVTVYATDDEAYDIWNKVIGLAPERIIRIGDNKGGKYESDNFWKMGDVGPCGPCSEVFYDHGPEIPGGLPGTPEEDGDRYIEIWNLVFMQFNQLADGTMEPLAKPAVDTGMGIERLAAVLQHVNSNYQIDLFKNLINAIKQELNYQGDQDSKSLRVIADHLRAVTFMIADGIEPSNEKRGYVLRRIMRRAIRHGYLLGKKEPFLCNLIDKVVAEMDFAGAYITPKIDYIKQVVKDEEIQFAKTIELGMALLNKELKQLDQAKELDGKVAFKLYDTYGFPLDLSQDIAREQGITIDLVGFEQEMEQQRSRAKASNSFALDYNKLIKVDSNSIFTGYESLNEQSKIISLYQAGELVEQLNDPDQEGIIFVEQTPFYAQSGGQVGDRGVIKQGDNLFIVTDTKKYGNAIAHHGNLVQGSFKLEQQVELAVDPLIRQQTILNHTATHLLRSALVAVVGSHISQKGSMNNEFGLRFDYNNKNPLTAEQINQVELLVNQYIRKNLPVITKELPIEEASKLGAEAAFGEKYGDIVRVVIIGDGKFSTEFCGGVHVAATGDLGYFKIKSDSSVAAGIRRIEALTGDNAVAASLADSQTINQLCSLTTSATDKLVETVSALNTKARGLEKQLQQLELQIALYKIPELLNQVVTVNDIKILIAKVEFDKKVLKTVADDLKARLGNGIVLLANEKEQLGLIALVSKELSNKIPASLLIGELNKKLDGKGGGKSEIAMSSAKNSPLLDQELNNILLLIKELIAN